MVVGTSVLWARSDREVVDLLKDGQLVLVCSWATRLPRRRRRGATLREAGQADPPAARPEGKSSL
jgi:hypothetical protein